ncbi:MAG: LPS export ABC transporter periplasmic protein LptC [Deltaproteobacteria bacterium]|nr:LPS export ABC transporter periplasmic protein LptC [Candidatus Zymogenaceae bacterium]
MKRTKFILGILIILIVTGIVIALYVSSRKLKEAEDKHEETTVTESGPPSIEADKLKYTESEGGKTLYEIESGQAKFFKDESRTEFTDIRVTFIYQDQYKILVSGDRGVLNTETKDITIYDNVKITAASDYTMSADTLTYNADRNEISTDDTINVTGPKAEFSGKGLRFNMDTEELFIVSDISTTIMGDRNAAPPPATKTGDGQFGFTTVGGLDAPIRISSAGFMASRNGGFFRYTGGAVAVYKDASLTASSITVYMDIAAGKIKKIVAGGGARLNQADIKSTAGIMTLDYVKNVMTLENSPVIWRGDDMVKGDKILYLLGENKSVVLGTDSNRAHLTIYPQEEF